MIYSKLTATATKELFDKLSGHINNVGMNVAYHALIHGNTECLDGRDRNTVRQLGDFMHLLPVVWDKDASKYAFDVKKSIKICELNHFTYNAMTFEEFVIKAEFALKNKETAKALAKATEKAKKDTKTDLEKCKTSITNLLSKHTTADIYDSMKNDPKFKAIMELHALAVSMATIEKAVAK
jgi:hypothetical protein